MYISGNPKTKKAVKEGIATGKEFRVYQPGIGDPPPSTGEAEVTVCGPHFPTPHKWYGTVKLKDGIVISIK